MSGPDDRTGGDPLDRTLDWLLKKMAALSGIILFVMMFLVVANTLTRKFFNAPIAGAFEITQSLLTLAIFLSLAYTQRVGGHISVDVLSRHFSGSVQLLARLMAPALGFLCFAWATYANWHYAMDSLQMNEQEWGEITYPLWPVKMLMCIGLGILTLQFLADLIRQLRIASRGNG